MKFFIYTINLPTIELALTTAFINWLGQEIKVVGSGRTDKLVHAYGQVIHFDLTKALKPEIIQKALNSFLPLDIRIMAVEAVDITFHARFSAKKKEYHYKITTKANDVFSLRYAYYCYNLDLSLMQEAANYFVGEHDFAGFKASGTSSKSSVRTIYSAKVTKDNESIAIELTGNGFLYNMVRIISGTLLDVGLQKIKPEEIKNIIEEKDRQKAGKTLPAHGLYLVEVKYN